MALDSCQNITLQRINARISNSAYFGGIVYASNSQNIYAKNIVVSECTAQYGAGFFISQCENLEIEDWYSDNLYASTSGAVLFFYDTNNVYMSNMQFYNSSSPMGGMMRICAHQKKIQNKQNVCLYI